MSPSRCIPAASRGSNRAFAGAVLALSLSVPIAADVTELRITEINPSLSLVEVTNIGVTTFTATSDLPFSHRSNVSASIPSSTVFAPGESREFTVSGLDVIDSDLWLYADPNFANSSSIISGLKWGPAANIGRVSIAVSAGIWPDTSAFVPAQTSSSLSLKAIAYDTTLPANWSEGLPSPVAFFGTGTRIEDPLPNVEKSDTIVYTLPIAAGLASPVCVVEPDDGSDRLFICDQIGKVLIWKDGELLANPLLDVTTRLVTLNNFFDERGLIGLALHPNFAVNPRIYTLTSEPKGAIPADFPSLEPAAGFNHQGVVAEWTIDAGNPDRVNLSSRRELLRVDEPQANHNGGTLRFGPDGYLYIALGDGGNRDDDGPGHIPDGNSQSLENPLGKLLRIQVDGGPFPNGKYGVPPGNPFVAAPGIDEIWAYGLRNPYSFSFDRGGSHQLFLADVGQGEIEEINIMTAGANCGWRLKEGSYFFDANGSANGFITSIPVKPIPPDLLEPIAEYDHGSGISIIGGFVYRGTGLPGLQGHYIFGDFGLNFSEPTGKLFYLDEQSQVKQPRISSSDRELGLWVKGFGEDQLGELYVCGSTALGPSGTSGVVLKLVGQNAATRWNYYH